MVTIKGIRSDLITVVDPKNTKHVDSKFLNKNDGDSGYVSLTISDESRKAMADMRKAVPEEERDNYDNFLKKKEELLSGKIAPEIDFHFEIGNKLNNLMRNGGKEHYTIPEKSSLLKDAYVEVRDDIVKGYQDGTRKVYTEDQDVEGGYRQKTIQEELDSLDNVFKDYTKSFAAQAKEETRTMESLGRYINSTSESKVDIAHRSFYNAAKKDYVEWKENGGSSQYSESTVSGSAVSSEWKLSSKAKDYLAGLRSDHSGFDFIVADPGDDFKKLVKESNSEYTVIFSSAEMERMSYDKKFAAEKMQSVNDIVRMTKKIMDANGWVSAFGKKSADRLDVNGIGVSDDANGILTLLEGLNKKSGEDIVWLNQKK